MLPHTSDGFAAELEDIGGWGVGCFFVLTGFLLARPYLEVILDPQIRNFPSTRLFLTRRFLRIWPLYAFAVIITALGGLIHGHRGVTFANVASHLAFLHGFVPAYDGAPFGPLWTMAVDAQFYLLLPVIALGTYTVVRKQPRVLRLRAIVGGLCFVMIASIGWRVFIVTHAPSVLSDFNTSIVYVRNVVGMGASFALGIALALFEVLGVRFRREVWVMAFYAGLAMVALFCIVSIKADRSTSLVIGDPLAGLSAVLLLGALIEGHFTGLSRLARSPITASLAALSYAVYLFHKPVIVGVHDFLVARGHGESAGAIALMILLSIAILTVVAMLAHRFVEQPFLDLRDKNREVATVLPEAPFRIGDSSFGSDARRKPLEPQAP